MDMLHVSSTSMGQASAAKLGSNANGTAGSEGEGFQQALVQIMGTEANGGSEQPSTVGLLAIAAGLEALTAGAEQGATPTVEDISFFIEGLVDQLDASMAQSNESNAALEQLEQLQALLDSLQALLALLGVPMPPTNTGSGDASETVDAHEMLANVKSGIQDGLLQLQAALQLGAMKQLKGQEPFALIMAQLQTMAVSLSEDKSSSSSSKAQSEAALPAWLMAQPATTKDTSALLQRLSQAVNHPSVLNGAISSAAEAAGMPYEEMAGEAKGGESLASGTLPFIGPDNVKEFSPLLHKAAAAPSAFVLADDFAETMNGMIVSKFDIHTVSGLSEAKLMLFPEHLGQVDVRISMQNGVLTAIFQTDSAMAKDMLDNQMAQLRASLQAQGLHVDKLEVTQSSSSSELSQQHAGHGQQGGQSSGNRQGFRDDQKVTDNAFESDLVEQAAIQGLGYGRSINETA